MTLEMQTKPGLSHSCTLTIGYCTHSSPQNINTGIATGIRGQIMTVTIEITTIRTIQNRPAIIVNNLILNPTNLDIILSSKACI